MARKRKKHELDEPPFTMTPMIDCIFLLLIFFILLPPKQIEGRLDSHLPRDKGLNPQPKELKQYDKIKIKLRRIPNVEPDVSTESGISVKVNQTLLGRFQELPDALMQISAGMEEANNVPVEIHGDQDIPFLFIIKALNACKIARMTKVEFAAPPEKRFLKTGSSK